MAEDDLDYADVNELRRRLYEAEETLNAIRHGEADALVIADGEGERVYTLRGADAPYRALIEQMQEGAVTLSKDGAIVYCNRRFADMVGTPLEQVIAQPIQRFIESADRALLNAPLVNGIGGFRTTLRRSTGRPIDAHISLSTVRLEDDVHRTLIVSDISTLTKMQRENRSKDEFLAMLSHELRNPLGAIAGALQVLQLAELYDARAVRAREVIERQVGQMARLVDDLLEVGRVVTGKITLNQRPIDLATVVRDLAAGMTAGPSLQHRIALEAESAWVLGDAVRLEQIVSNLISNALKFSAPHQTVSVSLRAQGGEAVLIVRDEGQGIEPELLPRIFDLFVQGEASPARSGGGLGIGLTLVRRLVELHGGTVSVSSAGHGQGARFEVRLPLSAAEEVTEGQQHLNGHHAPRRVLLVDDNVDAREMCSLALGALGHDVRTATTGEEALELIREWRPDVAIVDIGLPTIDGHELARRLRLRSNGQPLALIALTGYGFPEDRARSQEAGFDQHLVKPLSPAVLREAIETTIEQSQQH